MKISQGWVCLLLLPNTQVSSQLWHSLEVDYLSITNEESNRRINKDDYVYIPASSSHCHRWVWSMLDKLHLAMAGNWLKVHHLTITNNWNNTNKSIIDISIPTHHMSHFSKVMTPRYTLLSHRALKLIESPSFDHYQQLKWQKQEYYWYQHSHTIWPLDISYLYYRALKWIGSQALNC